MPPKHVEVKVILYKDFVSYEYIKFVHYCWYFLVNNSTVKPKRMTQHGQTQMCTSDVQWRTHQTISVNTRNRSNKEMTKGNRLYESCEFL
jgi:hypothetical protein